MTDEVPDPDGAPEERRTRSGIRRKLAVLSLVLLLAGVAIMGDWLFRNREMSALVEQMELSEKAMASGDQQLVHLVEQFGKVKYPTKQDIGNFGERLETVASLAAADLIESNERVASVPHLPWHRSVSRAQSSYLKHGKAWESYFTEVAQDFRQIYEQHPEISATYRISERYVRDAVPRWPLGNLRDRVSKVFRH